MPKTPDEWLAASSPPEKTKGVLKVFLGYAPGVGKTYAMLSEAIRRHSRGEDVVTGIVETHGRKGIAELAAKIDVLSTVNIQHIESIAPTVRAITGVVVRETVPDWVLRIAEETVMVDLTPEALQNRMKRGDVYDKEKVEQALTNFFRRGNLIALRELALRQVAEQVDRSLSSYLDEKDIQQNWAVRERIAVCISSNPRAQYLLARAARMARRMDAELYALHVDVEQDKDSNDEKALAANLQFAESLGATAVRLKGRSVADAAARFVRDKHVTQMIFGRSAGEGWRKLLYLNAINRFLRDAPAVDVHIVTQESD
jgi:two-component system sensor histidine kinase KdpD